MLERVSPDRAQQVESLKELSARHVMTAALNRGIYLEVLFAALIESAASAFASGVVIDGHAQVLCARTDEEHIQAACQRFRDAAQRQLDDARQTLLQPSTAFPVQGRPS